LQKWVHPRKSEAKNGLISKPGQKKTKREKKEHVSQIIEGIEKGEISEDDVKDIIDTAAAGIKSEVYAVSVGTKIQPAIKTVRQIKKKKDREPKPIDNFDRLHKLGLKYIEGLQLWADGAMKPDSSDEAACAKGILMGGASCIVQLSRLGIDVVDVYETFMKGKEEDENEIRKKIK
jgi:hypothetical protein